MIDSIHIASTATYATVQTLDGLKTFNFLFGANGTGKTTISRLLADPAATSFAACSVNWHRGTVLETFVYNRDFVAANFGESPIRGVFTLGQPSVEHAEALRRASTEHAALTAELEHLRQTLGDTNLASGKRADLVALEDELAERCWTQQVKHQAAFSAALKGYRNSKASFKQKILEQRQVQYGDVPLPALAELEAKAASIFASAPSAESLIVAPSPGSLLSSEAEPILGKVVVGSKDVEIAAMIESLGNSDWVKQGQPFFKANHGTCPFCQQAAPDSLSRSLDEYFSAAFVADMSSIEDLAQQYTASGRAYFEALDLILRGASPRLDIVTLKTRRDLVASKIHANSALIETKRKEPSRVIALDSLGGDAQAITAIVEQANQAIVAHNATVANLKTEQATLTRQVWRHLIERELAGDLGRYDLEKAGHEKAVRSLEGQIAAKTEAIRKKSAEVRALERGMTSVQPTVDDINALLREFSYQGFSLVRMGESDTYALQRAGAVDARHTLSEGERTFVTFLYFYFLLRGSPQESGTVTPRVAVFDDPVSSLDSDALFIVSSLVRRLMEEVRAGTSSVRQVFVLSHNVHFHKEVTFDSRRGHDRVLNEETFWVVRKPAGTSIIEACSRNPVSSSYAMLWSEVKRTDLSSGSLQNSLRRILEGYFKHLGGIDPTSLEQYFAGRDKVICRSLFSWINAGSHGFHDDAHYAFDQDSADRYREVFKAVFERAGHERHYSMMMGDDLPAAAVQAASPAA